MEVILLEKIRNLGLLGEKVKVAPGYGRNFLVPNGKAIYATAENLKKFEARRADLEQVAAEAMRVAQTRQQALAALPAVKISAKAGEEGKLFGSIGTRDIADAVTQAGVEIDKSEVILPMGVLRQLGEYELEIEVHGDVMATVKINIVSE
ncbi:MAG: rplI [Gammaproteobacteria bacterium]|nr:rplI [Gammaproteobacteria bacterium]